MSFKKRLEDLEDKIKPKDTIQESKRALSALETVFKRLEVRDHNIQLTQEEQKDREEFRDDIAAIKKDIAESEKAK